MHLIHSNHPGNQVFQSKWEAPGAENMPRFVARVGRKLFNAYFLILGLLPGKS